MPDEKKICYPLPMHPPSYQALKAICAHDGRSIKEGLSIAIEDYVSKRALMVARSLKNTSEKIKEREGEE
jgi:hypothetical protein